MNGLTDLIEQRRLWEAIKLLSELKHLGLPGWFFDSFALSSEDLLPAPSADERDRSIFLSIELRRFDQTYIEFLNEQIELNMRGSAYSALLERRSVALEPYVNQEFLHVLAWIPSSIDSQSSISLRLVPQSWQVVHLEVL